MSNAFADSIKQWRGCLGIVALAFLLLCSIIGYSRFTDSLSSLPWSFRVVAGLVFLGGGIFVLFEVYFELSNRNDAKEATVTIDLDSQRALRVEKLISGKTTQKELKLEQVTHVLIHGNDAVHTLKVTLESQNRLSFPINSDIFFDSQPMLEFGKKLGAFIKKPVVFKLTEGGELISEETVQS